MAPPTMSSGLRLLAAAVAVRTIRLTRLLELTLGQSQQAPSGLRFGYMAPVVVVALAVALLLQAAELVVAAAVAVHT